MPLDYTNYVIAGEEILDEDSRTNVHTAIFRLDENSVTCCRVKQECFAEVAYFPDEEDNRATAYAKTLRMTFREGDTLHIPNNNGASVAVRVLEDKSPYKTTYLKNSANDLTFVVNGVKCLADKDYLSAISPVFKKMLKGSFAESKCAEVELKGIESADLLNDFLLAVSPQRVQPNPENIVALVELANRYDVQFLMKDIERHLKKCFELPFMPSLIIAERYHLESLKVMLLEDVSKERLSKVYKENRKELSLLNPDTCIELLRKFVDDD